MNGAGFLEEARPELRSKNALAQLRRSREEGITGGVHSMCKGPGRMQGDAAHPAYNQACVEQSGGERSRLEMSLEVP